MWVICPGPYSTGFVLGLSATIDSPEINRVHSKLVTRRVLQPRIVGSADLSRFTQTHPRYPASAAVESLTDFEYTQINFGLTGSYLTDCRPKLLEVYGYAIDLQNI